MLLNRQPSSEKIFKIDSPRPHPVTREGIISGPGRSGPFHRRMASI